MSQAIFLNRGIGLCGLEMCTVQEGMLKILLPLRSHRSHIHQSPRLILAGFALVSKECFPGRAERPYNSIPGPK